jgi:hypothetical protein
MKRSRITEATMSDLFLMIDEAKIKALVEKQANDEGCWFVAQTITEAYLQSQLRLLHAAIEGTDYFGRPVVSKNEASAAK